jgi:hypothetical protein
MTIFYCLTFETPTIWRARYPYLHILGRGWTSYTPRHSVPFPSPPTSQSQSKKVPLRLTISQSVIRGVERHLGLMTRYLFLFDSYGLVFVGQKQKLTAGTLTPGIVPRWDPWPYICSMPRPLFFSFRCSSLLIKEGFVYIGLYIQIGV